MKNIHFKIIIPKKLVNKLSKLLFDKTKRWFIERMKQKIKLTHMNKQTLIAQVSYMLLGMQLTILIETLINHPDLFRFIDD